jgi:starch synthase (maltosyl-transferring)
VQMPLELLNHKNGERYLMQDVLTSNSYYWENEWNFIELNPHVLPFHLFKIEKQ